MSLNLNMGIRQNWWLVIVIYIWELDLVWQFDIALIADCRAIVHLVVHSAVLSAVSCRNSTRYRVFIV